MYHENGKQKPFRWIWRRTAGVQTFLTNLQTSQQVNLAFVVNLVMGHLQFCRVNDDAITALNNATTSNATQSSNATCSMIILMYGQLECMFLVLCRSL